MELTGAFYAQCERRSRASHVTLRTRPEYDPRFPPVASNSNFIAVAHTLAAALHEVNEVVLGAVNSSASSVSALLEIESDAIKFCRRCGNDIASLERAAEEFKQSVHGKVYACRAAHQLGLTAVLYQRLASLMSDVKLLRPAMVRKSVLRPASPPGARLRGHGLREDSHAASTPTSLDANTRTSGASGDGHGRASSDAHSMAGGSAGGRRGVGASTSNTGDGGNSQLHATERQSVVARIDAR